MAWKGARESLRTSTAGAERRGFTLLELVVTLAVLALAAGPGLPPLRPAAGRSSRAPADDESRLDALGGARRPRHRGARPRGALGGDGPRAGGARRGYGARRPAGRRPHRAPPPGRRARVRTSARDGR